MKKLNAKFIVSAFIAAAMASTAAVSVSADIDYPHAPVYAPVNASATTGAGTTDTATNTDTSTTTPDDKTDESTGATVVGEAAVEDAIKSGESVDVTVDDNGNASVQEAAIGAIAEGDKAVTFDVDTDGIDYSVTIDPDEIEEVKAINLAMDIEVAEDDATGESSIVITPAQKGAFGMTLQITIPAAALENIDANAAKLYYVDDNGNTTLVEGGLTVNADGSVTIKISHASYYVISDVDLTEGGEVDAGLDADDDDDTDVTIDEPSTSDDQGKDNTSVVVNGNGSDSNPITGTTLALGSLAVFAAAAVATSKKRK